ncbi:hypothetical protein [Klebsiella phage vB_KpnM_TU02]|nr:hypothetical protein [Klebsiella phage vB_KpnM_TU02]
MFLISDFNDVIILFTPCCFDIAIIPQPCKHVNNFVKIIWGILRRDFGGI